MSSVHSSVSKPVFLSRLICGYSLRVATYNRYSDSIDELLQYGDINIDTDFKLIFSVASIVCLKKGKS